jgi:hypothetical protein
MNRRATLTLSLLALLLPLPGGADDVYLVNGQSFEGVVAEIGETRVHVQLEYGRISLPLEQVDRVVKAATPLQVYRERRQALEGALDADAEEWLELARYARAHELRDGFRAAILVAAALDPSARGLAAPMAEIGYLLDEETDRWLPEAEVMRRRGLVRYDGEWLSEPEARRRQLEREQVAALARSAAPVTAHRSLEAGPTDNDVMLAQVEVMQDMVGVLEREVEREPEARAVPWVPGYSVGVGVGRPLPASPQAQSAWRALTIRQSGSMLPVHVFEQD